MTTHLIDADGIAWASAHFTEGFPDTIARANVNEIIEQLFADVNVADYVLYLTGSGNFRYNIYPEYKAQRKDKPKPTNLEVCREHLKSYWKAYVSEGCEADDLIAIDHTQHNHESIIVSVDKDFDQLFGWHYNPRKKERYIVSPDEATRFFYYQLLVGDSADNIKGVDKIGKIRANRLLDQGTNEEEWFNIVRDAYGCDEEMAMNAKCLWLWREHGDIWKWPEWATPMEELDGLDTGPP